MRTTLLLAATIIVIGLISSAGAEELSAIMNAPDRYLGKKIEVAAPVAFNTEPEGGEHKIWNFSVGSEHENLRIERKGFNPAVIMKGYQMVEQARRAGDTITVFGRLKHADTGPVLELNSLGYKGTSIRMNEGPFVDTVYGDCYPGSPKFYDGYTYYPGEFPS